MTKHHVTGELIHHHSAKRFSAALYNKIVSFLDLFRSALLCVKIHSTTDRLLILSQHQHSNENLVDRYAALTMACLSPEHEPPQRSRTETALYHTREHVVAWVVVAILAISRLILIAQFDEFGKSLFSSSSNCSPR